MSDSSGTGTPIPVDTAAAVGSGTQPEQRGGQVLSGNRPMKEYYFYDSDINELGTLGAISTFFFSIGSACLGFSINISKDLAFANGVPEKIMSEWRAYNKVSLLAAVVCFVIGIILYLNRFNRIEQLKSQTKHPGQQPYSPRKRFIIAAYILGFCFCILGGMWLGPKILPGIFS